ncbi:membrane protein of unknown function [bacterium BMS3Abin07]|nr:membrane protein of unknown function [bacterium BMS3Abin07]GBE31223.1 membrane protein of unknown function [bacterium BMS3Bbin05]HDO23128.1 phage holin family protein [Nitrospirota bacterium]HDZ87411.1 phage holin family protein [Nitrospirota bacterium]
MRLLILQWFINAVAIIISVRIVDGITFNGRWWQMIIIGSVFGIVNSLIKPIVKFFTYPIIIITLGIFTLVINAAMLVLTSLISGFLNFGFEITGFLPALWGALIVSIISIILSWLTGLKGMKKERAWGKNA